MKRELEYERSKPTFDKHTFDKHREYVSNTNLTQGNKVIIKLESPDIEFSPEKVSKFLEEKVNTISFSGKPKDACQPGYHIIIVSISDQSTGQEYLSRSFQVKVVDFAFDHVSRPVISTMTSTVLAISSVTTFILTLLGKIDQTLGLASGATAAAVGTIIYSRFLMFFRRTRPSNIDQL